MKYSKILLSSSLTIIAPLTIGKISNSYNNTTVLHEGFHLFIGTDSWHAITNAIAFNKHSGASVYHYGVFQSELSFRYDVRVPVFSIPQNANVQYLIDLGVISNLVISVLSDTLVGRDTKGPGGGSACVQDGWGHTYKKWDGAINLGFSYNFAYLSEINIGRSDEINLRSTYFLNHLSRNMVNEFHSKKITENLHFNLQTNGQGAYQLIPNFPNGLSWKLGIDTAHGNDARWSDRDNVMPQAIQQGAASYDSGYQSNKSYDDWFNADLIQQSSFDWNKVMKIDYDYSFYDLNNTNSEMVLKYNDDYVDASLMAWDCARNQVSGQKTPDGHYNNSNWLAQQALENYAKTLPQYALDDISNAIIDGKLINTNSLSGIFDWTIPNTVIKPMEWYSDSSSKFSLLNFLIYHGHDDQKSLETALNDLPTLKWKQDYDFYAIDISSASTSDIYLNDVTTLLTQQLTYELKFIDGAADGQHTRTFNLTDLVGGQIELSFNYPSEDNTWFQLQSCITGSLPNLFNSCVSLGVCDTKNLIDGHPKVYSLDGSDSNYFRFQPPAFVLSHAMDEIDGNPQDKNFGFFYGATGLDGNPVFWDNFTKSLYSRTPSQIKSYLDNGSVPASESGIGNDVTFTETCFIKVKDSFNSEFNIDDIVDHVDWIANDNTGVLTGTIHFKDESFGDQPQTLNIQLFAKNVSIWKHIRSTPISAEPSQIDQQHIIDNLIKYNSISTTSRNLKDDEDDQYLFETNLNKTEFTQALQGITFKIQDDDNGKLDVIFSIRSLVYNVNETGMAIPPLTTFEIMDNDFIPFYQHKNSSLVWLWVILALVGCMTIIFIAIKIKQSKSKFKKNDDEDEEELNLQKHIDRKSGNISTNEEKIDSKSNSSYYTKEEMKQIKLQDKANKKASKRKSSNANLDNSDNDDINALGV